GASEQAPQSWITAAESVAAQLRKAVQPRRWRGIGLSAMIPTLVTARPGGEPARPATPPRGAASGPAPRPRGGTAGPAHAASSCANSAAATGCTGPPASGWTAATCSPWSCGSPTTSRPRGAQPTVCGGAPAAEPARAAAATWLLAAKDYLFGWLTGEIATDPSTATGFGCYRLADGALCEQVSLG